MSFKFFISYFSLWLTKARSRNKQLQRYAGDWATLEIMKTLLKNKRNYKKRAGFPDQDSEDAENDYEEGDAHEEEGEEEDNKEDD